MSEQLQQPQQSKGVPGNSLYQAKPGNAVPFYPNHEDGMRCMLAVYRMVIRHFLHKELSWEQLTALTGYQPKRAAWTVKPLIALATEYGLSVRMIEPFDYRRFASEGKDYLYDLHDNEEVAWYLEHTNILEIQPYISQFLATIRPQCHRASLQDINEMLDEGRLVFVSVNSRVLSGREGYANHALLVIGRIHKGRQNESNEGSIANGASTRDGDDDIYIVHDPGLPPQPNRRISARLLWQAMGGNQTTSEVTGFKLRKAGLRLDQYVIQQKPTLSRSYATRLITEGRVLVNDALSKPGYKLRDADTVAIDYDEADEPDIPPIDLPILYEDDDCIVIDKPAGVLTHNKGVRHVEATVASFVRSRAKLLEGERPGIVHRLDRATSGVMICAKTSKALSWLQKQFHDRSAKKTYAAVVCGTMRPEFAVIDMPIERNPKAPATFRVGANGKPAQTYYKTVTIGPSGHYSLLELQPKTGRTHQLRVHLAYHNHPIVGDMLYGGEVESKRDNGRMYLHAHKLEITLPSGQTKEFEAPIPAEFYTKMED